MHLASFRCDNRRWMASTSGKSRRSLSLVLWRGAQSGNPKRIPSLVLWRGTQSGTIVVSLAPLSKRFAKLHVHQTDANKHREPRICRVCSRLRSCIILTYCMARSTIPNTSAVNSHGPRPMKRLRRQCFACCDWWVYNPHARASLPKSNVRVQSGMVNLGWRTGRPRP